MFFWLCAAGLISCAAAAAVLDLPQPECQLLLDTLAAVINRSNPAAASSSAVAQPTALVPVHLLSLFLMVQLFDRDARKPETQDCWPDPQSNNACGEGLHRSTARSTACPGGRKLLWASAVHNIIAPSQSRVGPLYLPDDGCT
jgi:hypothetical protein